MSIREDLELAWKSVEGTKVSDPKIRLLETTVSTVIGKVLVGLDARGRRHLCLPTTPDELGERDAASRGVLIDTVNLLEGETPKPFVDVQCRDAKLNPIFSVVAADILEAVRTAPAAPFKTCHSILDRWRQLLEKERPSLMSAEELGALFAELLVLEQLAAIDPAALSSWRGPERDLHDFVCGPIDIEVKSTRSAVASVIEVSDLRQLDSTPGVKLYLAFHRIHMAPGRGRSVPALVDDLRELGLDESELFRRLLEYGYDQRDSERYVDLTFELLEERWYVVDDAFPRLVPSAFLPGHPKPEVKKIRYAVDISGATGILTEGEKASVVAAAATMEGAGEP